MKKLAVNIVIRSLRNSPYAIAAILSIFVYFLFDQLLRIINPVVGIYVLVTLFFLLISTLLALFLSIKSILNNETLKWVSYTYILLFILSLVWLAVDM